MRFRLVFILLFLIVYAPANGQTLFNKAVNVSNIDALGSVLESDSTFYCSGMHTGTAYGKRGFVRINSQGDTLYVKKYGLDSSRYYLGLGTTLLKKNNRFYLLGSRLDVNTSIYHSNLLIVNYAGDSIRQIDFDPYDSSYAQGMVFDRYGSLLIAGTISFASGEQQATLMKCDSLGNLKWIKYYGGSSADHFYSIDTASDGGYIMAGYTFSFGSGANDVYVVKVDTAGAVQWQKFFGSTSSDAGFVKSLKNGQYLIHGGNYVTGYADQKAFARKINSSGNLIWHKNYINLTMASENFISVAVSPFDNSFVFGGLLYGPSVNSGNPVGYIVRTDTSGNQIFYRLHQLGLNDNYVNDVIITSDNYIVASGYVFPDGTGILTQDGWFFKMDSLGCIVSGCSVDVQENAFEENTFLVYPNPSTGDFTIDLGAGFYPKQGALRIVDAKGMVVYQNAVKSQKTAVSVPFLDKGIYFAILVNDYGQQFTQKIILE